MCAVRPEARAGAAHYKKEERQRLLKLKVSHRVVIVCMYYYSNYAQYALIQAEKKIDLRQVHNMRVSEYECQ